jgi:hypothetical protein
MAAQGQGQGQGQQQRIRLNPGKSAALQGLHTGAAGQQRHRQDAWAAACMHRRMGALKETTVMQHTALHTQEEA